MHRPIHRLASGRRVAGGSASCAVAFLAFGGWAFAATATVPLFEEAYRPQFHFTAERNWLNDPNGLVFYRGEYHLFFQHNPSGIEWGNMTWGHAVSSDLVHWRQREHALLPDRFGTMFSGSAVVDWDNTAGLQTGNEKTLIAMYTAAGGTSKESPGQPFTQCLAYSNDRGRTWTKYGGNPVLPCVNADNRDPKILWHAPTRRWIMVLYVPRPDAQKKKADGQPETVHTLQFFASTNLLVWTYLSRIDGFYECPDLFELPVAGDPRNTRWVVFGADGDYWIGRFDGREFHRESGKHRGDWGANFYAAQSYSDIPARDGRRILVGWMRGGKYPNMPFNQQMAFPVELSLRATADGLRLCKQPVREIESLYAKTHRLEAIPVTPGTNALAACTGELLDLDLTLDPGDAEQIVFDFRGAKAVWMARDQQFSVLGRTAPLPRVNGRIQLRVLIDRSSMEVFGNDGVTAMSSCFLPESANRNLALGIANGQARLVSARIRELKSAWPQPGRQ